MRIGIIGHLKHPVAKPYAGGLEAFTDTFVRRLADRGHDVTLFASGDSDPSLPLSPIIDHATIPDSRRRLGRVHHEWIESVEDEAYAELFADLSSQSFDVIHNHSLNPIPLQFSSFLRSPMVTTLHAPPLPRMVEELSTRTSVRCGQFINISHANAVAWQPWVSQQVVVHNGVDTEFWNSCGQQRRQHRAIWFGRILAEKGTHLAIEAAKIAGLPLDIVGPIADEEYFNKEIVSRLNQQVCYLGHMDHSLLCERIGRASVALVTPCWDEPFGLVVTEALACGTPVAGFARGALPELINNSIGRLARPGDVYDLADAARHCLSVSAAECRHTAQSRFSFDRMVDEYEAIYRNSQVEVAA